MVEAEASSTPHVVGSRHRFLAILVGAIVFAIAHTQAALYFSNQNQYLLHGLAAGGLGHLDHDWLATTLDPTPVFSLFVAFAHRHFGDFAFQAALFILEMVYFVSLLAIGSLVIPQGPRRRFSLFVFSAIIVLVHAGLVRWLSVQILGVDYPWFLQCGLAGQYVLGPVLQPSAIGVLLISSFAAFAHGRLLLAVMCLVLACLVHATYLLPSAMLTLTYMMLLWREGRARTALVGLGTLLGVLPVVAVDVYKFAPTDPATFAEAKRLLTELRIPHHAQVRRWFDFTAGVQIAWVGLAIIACRGVRGQGSGVGGHGSGVRGQGSGITSLMAIPGLMAVVLTIFQLATGSQTLALLFPWRISSVLVPIATAVLVACVARRIPERRWIVWAGSAALAVAVVGGVIIESYGLAYRNDDRELPALEFVRVHKQPGDVYLLPMRIPVSAGPRGSVSTSFTDPPGTKEKHLIAIDLQRFRLLTGAPVYVDYKSVPYKDSDVLEWYRRLQKCVHWYDQRDWQSQSLRQDLRNEGITHILMPANAPSIEGTGYELVYGDPVYRIYRIVPD